MERFVPFLRKFRSCSAAFGSVVLAFALTTIVDTATADELRIVLKGGVPAEEFVQYGAEQLPLGPLTDNQNRDVVPKFSRNGDFVILAQEPSANLSDPNRMRFVVKVASDGSKSAVAVFGRAIDGIGLPAGTTFGNLSEPHINDLGDVAFLSSLSGPGITASNNAGILIKPNSASTIRPFVLKGQPIPDSGMLIGTLPSIVPLQGAAQSWLATQTLTGTTSNALLKLAAEGVGFSRVYHSGESVPEVPGTISYSPTYIEHNEQGDLIFVTTNSGPGTTTTNRTVLWSETNGTRRAVVRASQPVPEGINGVPSIFAQINIGAQGPAVNNRGEIAFSSSTARVDNNLINGGGIWLTNLQGELLTRIVANGSTVSAGDPLAGCQVVPSTSSGGKSLFITDDGAVLFFATFSGCLSSSRRGLAISLPQAGGWRTIKSIFTFAQQAVDSPTGALFVDEGSLPAPSVSSSGALLVWLKVRSADPIFGERYGLFRYLDGELHLIVWDQLDALGSTLSVYGEREFYPQMGGSPPTCTVNRSGQGLCLGQITTRDERDPFPITLKSAIFSISTAGTTNLVGVNEQGMRFADGQDVFVSTLGFDPATALNDSGEYLVRAHLLTAGANYVVIKGQIFEGGNPQCLADFNADGSSTQQDLFDFLAAWFALAPSADINRVGGVTVQDIFDFLEHWFAGC